MRSYYDILLVQITDCLDQRNEPNQTPSQKARVTRRVKDLQAKMEIYMTMNPEHPAHQNNWQKHLETV